MNKQLRYVVLAALMAAMIFLFTAYVLHIPVGTGGGYIHLGDTMVYIAAALLPLPYAVAAAAIGGGLADVLSGAAVWAVPTVIIKSLMVLFFTSKTERVLCRRNQWAPLPAGIVGVVGYFLAEIAIVTLSGGTLSAAVAGGLVAVLPNMVQELAGGVAFIVLAAVLDKAKLKSRLFAHF